MKRLSKSKLVAVCAILFCIVSPMQNTYAWGTGWTHDGR